MRPRVLSKEEVAELEADHSFLMADFDRLDDEKVDALFATIRDLEETVGRFQQIVNYWFPRLGYSKANEMAYPALGDDRATEPPAIRDLEARLNECPDYTLGYSIATTEERERCIRIAEKCNCGECECCGCGGRISMAIRKGKP